MDLLDAKKRLDAVINKARTQFYKPIQIAEVLHRNRIERDIDLNDVETYRTRSKKWRDDVCEKIVGRGSTSSAAIPR